MDRLKVFIVGPCSSDWIANSEVVENLEDANIVLFSGTHDVDPSFYDCKKFPCTESDIAQDQAAKEIFSRMQCKQLAVGIGKGAQFLCCMYGGRIVQDISEHYKKATHSITNGDKVVSITTRHHQMMYPWSADQYDILYWTLNAQSDFYVGEKVRNIVCEPEVVLFQGEEVPRSLAIQGHPEIMRKEAPIINILNELINKWLED